VTDGRRVRGLRLLVAAALLATVAACSSAPTPLATIILADDAIAAPQTLEVGDGPAVLEVSAQARSHHNLSICRSAETGRCDERPILQRMVIKPDARDPSAVPDQTRALVLAADWTAVVETDLTPGRWRLYCGIIGHAERGMDTLMDVVTADGSPTG
jgi:uncharacterized cupredoxin-like copper-binding protein